MTTPAEIAHLLLTRDGNAARNAILTEQRRGAVRARSNTDAVLVAIDVVDELANMFAFPMDDGYVVPGHQRALAAVRRCLKGE